MDSVALPPFEDGGVWKSPVNDGEWRRYRVGTCIGIYRARGIAYELLAIENSKPGNGHVEAVFSWFFKSCKRDKMHFVILSVMNDGFARKLINHGFTKFGEDYYFRYEDM